MILGLSVLDLSFGNHLVDRHTDRHEQNNIPPLLRRGTLKCDFHRIRSQGLTETIFKLNSCIKETKVLTKCHENWAKNVTSRVLTFSLYTYRKKCPGHVFLPIRTIVQLVQDINKTNVLTNFHDDWAKIVTSRPNWEYCHYIHIKKNAPPTGGHVFSPIGTIFELVRVINKNNVLTNFHDDWTKIVTSRVLTRENCHYIKRQKNAPPTGGHVFSPIWTIFWNSSEILIKPMKTAPPTCGHVFQQTGTTFELNQDIIKTNILTNFKLGRDFIGAKLLTKFHEDGTRNVASRVFTSKC
ncbi:hypothetical protein DPMN_173876 [Dreissena polymorpha]|uniref:Uncharacterized protein n=1 Tax=Dreissena polymorpha TaxID=45954 RepID=A0A9D4IEL9_DREPO|nr:hypothetical protein DPMN_173876 [Dreissena polymorpha]